MLYRILGVKLHHYLGSDVCFTNSAVGSTCSCQSVIWILLVCFRHGCFCGGYSYGCFFIVYFGASRFLTKTSSELPKLPSLSLGAPGLGVAKQAGARFLVVFGCVDLHPSFLRRRIWGSLKFATPVIGTSLIVEKKCLQSGTLLAGKHVYIIGQRFDAWENWTAECAFLGRVQYRWAREEDSAAISQANTCMAKGKLYILYICIYIFW